MIFYFSGTGNSAWVAAKIATSLGDTVHDLSKGGEAHDLHRGEALGFVFPVHAWSPPQIVLRFISKLRLSSNPQYLYFVCTCGDDTGKTSSVFRKAVESRGWRCSAGYSVIMPNTYVCLPGFDVDPREVEERKLRDSAARVDWIVTRLSARHIEIDCHEGAMPLSKTYLLGPLFRKFLMSDRKFHVSDSCAGCGVCSRACPLGNIDITGGVPVWGGNCTMCLACYHHCPSHCVDYGSATVGKGQYRFHSAVGGSSGITDSITSSTSSAIKEKKS